MNGFTFSSKGDGNSQASTPITFGQKKFGGSGLINGGANRALFVDFSELDQERQRVCRDAYEKYLLDHPDEEDGDDKDLNAQLFAQDTLFTWERDNRFPGLGEIGGRDQWQSQGVPYIDFSSLPEDMQAAAKSAYWDSMNKLKENNNGFLGLGIGKMSDDEMDLRSQQAAQDALLFGTFGDPRENLYENAMTEQLGRFGLTMDDYNAFPDDMKADLKNTFEVSKQPTLDLFNYLQASPMVQQMMQRNTEAETAADKQQEYDRVRAEYDKEQSMLPGVDLQYQQFGPEYDEDSMEIMQQALDKLNGRRREWSEHYDLAQNYYNATGVTESELEGAINYKRELENQKQEQLARQEMDALFDESNPDNQGFLDALDEAYLTREDYEAMTPEQRQELLAAYASGGVNGVYQWAMGYIGNQASMGGMAPASWEAAAQAPVKTVQQEADRAELEQIMRNSLRPSLGRIANKLYQSSGIQQKIDDVIDRVTGRNRNIPEEYRAIGGDPAAASAAALDRMEQDARSVESEFRNAEFAHAMESVGVTMEQFARMTDQARTMLRDAYEKGPDALREIKGIYDGGEEIIANFGEREEETADSIMRAAIDQNKKNNEPNALYEAARKREEMAKKRLESLVPGTPEYDEHYEEYSKELQDATKAREEAYTKTSLYTARHAPEMLWEVAKGTGKNIAAGAMTSPEGVANFMRTLLEIFKIPDAVSAFDSTPLVKGLDDWLQDITGSKMSNQYFNRLSQATMPQALNMLTDNPQLQATHANAENMRKAAETEEGAKAVQQMTDLIRGNFPQIEQKDAEAAADTFVNKVMFSGGYNFGNMLPSFILSWAAGASALSGISELEGTHGINRLLLSTKNAIMDPGFIAVWMDETGRYVQDNRAALNDNMTYADWWSAMGSGFFSAIIEYRVTRLGNGVQGFASGAVNPTFGSFVGMQLQEPSEEMRQLLTREASENIADLLSGRDLRHPMDSEKQESLFYLGKYVDTAEEAFWSSAGMFGMTNTVGVFNHGTYSDALAAVQNGTATQEQRELVADLMAAQDNLEQIGQDNVMNPDEGQQHNAFAEGLGETAGQQQNNGQLPAAAAETVAAPEAAITPEAQAANREEIIGALRRFGVDELTLQNISENFGELDPQKLLDMQWAAEDQEKKEQDESDLTFWAQDPELLNERMAEITAENEEIKKQREAEDAELRQIRDRQEQDAQRQRMLAAEQAAQQRTAQQVQEDQALQAKIRQDEENRAREERAARATQEAEARRLHDQAEQAAAEQTAQAEQRADQEQYAKDERAKRGALEQGQAQDAEELARLEQEREETRRQLEEAKKKRGNGSQVNRLQRKLRDLNEQRERLQREQQPAPEYTAEEVQSIVDRQGVAETPAAEEPAALDMEHRADQEQYARDEQAKREALEQGQAQDAEEIARLEAEYKKTAVLITGLKNAEDIYWSQLEYAFGPENINKIKNWVNRRRTGSESELAELEKYKEEVLYPIFDRAYQDGKIGQEDLNRIFNNIYNAQEQIENNKFKLDDIRKEVNKYHRRYQAQKAAEDRAAQHNRDKEAGIQEQKALEDEQATLDMERRADQERYAQDQANKAAAIKTDWSTSGLKDDSALDENGTEKAPETEEIKKKKEKLQKAEEELEEDDKKTDEYRTRINRLSEYLQNEIGESESANELLRLLEQYEHADNETKKELDKEIKKALKNLSKETGVSNGDLSRLVEDNKAARQEYNKYFDDTNIYYGLLRYDANMLRREIGELEEAELEKAKEKSTSGLEENPAIQTPETQNEEDDAETAGNQIAAELPETQEEEPAAEEDETETPEREEQGQPQTPETQPEEDEEAGETEGNQTVTEPERETEESGEDDTAGQKPETQGQLQTPEQTPEDEDETDSSTGTPVTRPQNNNNPGTEGDAEGAKPETQGVTDEPQAPEKLPEDEDGTDGSTGTQNTNNQGSEDDTEGAPQTAETGENPATDTPVAENPAEETPEAAETDENPAAETGEETEEQKSQNARKVARNFGLNYLERNGTPRAGVNIRTWSSSVSQHQASQVSYKHSGRTAMVDMADLKAIDEYAKKRGIAVVIDDTIDNSTKNGYYQQTPGNPFTVHIAQDAENPLRTVFGHELYHAIVANNPAAARSMQQTWLSYAQRAGLDMAAETQKIADLYKKNGLPVPPAAVLQEEVIANSLYDIIGDQRTMQVLAAQNRGMVQQIRNWVSKVLQDIRSITSRYADRDAGARMLRDTAGAMENMRRMIDQALERSEAVDHSKKAVKSLGENGPMTKRYQERMEKAENRQDANRATRQLAQDLLRRMGLEASAENVNKMLNAALDFNAGRVAMSSALQRAGFPAVTMDAEMNRAFGTLAKYMDSIMGRDTKGYMELMKGEPETTQEQQKPQTPKEKPVRKLKRGDDVKLSLKTTAAQDAAYMDAVKRGDMKTAQEMVDLAADESLKNSKMRVENGKLREMYHGTPGKTFTLFDKKFIGTAREGDVGFFGKGFYFAYSKGEASMYGGNVINAYLDIENPYNFEKELETLNNKRVLIYGASDAVFLTNYAYKFPELADKHFVTVIKKGSGTETKLTLKQFADQFTELVNNKKFTLESLKTEYGTEWLVSADPEEITYEDRDGVKHSFIDYQYQSRYFDKETAENPLANAYDYMQKMMYNYIKLPRAVDVIQETEFSDAVQKRGYDGIIQSEYGDEAVVFNSNQIKSSDPVTYDDQGKVIPLSERFNPENEDIRWSVKRAEQDAAYLEAVEKEDAEAQQKLVDQAAKENGYTTEKAYHGSPSFGFTKFDKSISQNQIFVAYNENISKTYGVDFKVKKITEGIKGTDYDGMDTQTLINTFVRDTGQRVDRIDAAKLKEDVGKWYSTAINDNLAEPYATEFIELWDKFAADEISPKQFEETVMSKIRELRDAAEERYSSAKNEPNYHPALQEYRNAQGAHDDLSELFISNAMPYIKTKGDVFKVDTDDGIIVYMSRGELIQELKMNERLNSDVDSEGGIYTLYTRPGRQLVVDAHNANWSRIHPEWDNSGRNWKTREIAVYAKQHGYDSVRINNVFDHGGLWGDKSAGFGDIGIFFDTTDVKSADPITYDDQGKVIPLSERFNPENEDIRWSAKENVSVTQLTRDLEKTRDADVTLQTARALTARMLETNDTDVNAMTRGQLLSAAMAYTASEDVGQAMEGSDLNIQLTKQQDVSALRAIGDAAVRLMEQDPEMYEALFTEETPEEAKERKKAARAQAKARTADEVADAWQVRADYAGTDQNAHELIVDLVDAITNIRTKATMDQDGRVVRQTGHWKAAVPTLAKAIQQSLGITMSEETVKRTVREALTNMDEELARGVHPETALDNCLNMTLASLTDLYMAELNKNSDRAQITRDALNLIRDKVGSLVLMPTERSEVEAAAEDGLKGFRKVMSGVVDVRVAQVNKETGNAVHTTGQSIEDVYKDEDVVHALGLDPDLVNPGDQIMDLYEKVRALKTPVGRAAITTEETDMLHKVALNLVASYFTSGENTTVATSTAVVSDERHQEVLRQAEQLEKEVSEKQDELMMAQSELSALEEKYNAVVQNSQNLYNTLMQERKANVPAAQLEDLRAQMLEAQQNEAQAQKDLKAAERKLKDLQKKQTERQQKLRNLQKQLRAQEKQNEKQQRQMDRMLGRIDKLNNQILSEKQKVQQARAKAKAQQNRQASLDNIRKQGTVIRKMLAQPGQKTGYVPQEYVRPVADFVQALSENDGRKSAEMGKRVRDMVRDAQTSSDYAAQQLFADGLSDMVDRSIRLLEDKGALRNLTDEELRLVENTVAGVVNQLQYMNKFISNELKRERQESAAEAIGVLNKNPRAHRGAAGVASNILLQHMNAERVLDQLAHHEDNAISQSNEMFKNGYRVSGLTKMNMTKPYESLTTGENAKKFDRFAGKNATMYDTGIQILDTMGNETGRTWKLTAAQRVSLWFDVNYDQNREGMRAGMKREGQDLYQLTVPDQELLKKGKTDQAYKEGDRVYFTLDEAKAILDEMTDYDMAWVDAFKQMELYSRGVINDTSLRLKGYRLATVQDYFPIRRDSNFTKSDFQSVVVDNRLENQGWTKSRVNAHNPMLLMDVTQVINSQIQGVSDYVGYAIPIRDFTMLMNTSVGNNADSVKAAIARTQGTEMIKYLDQLMGDLQGTNRTENTWLDNLRGKQAAATLTLNMSVQLKQTASYPVAAAVVGWSPLAKAMGSFLNRKGIDPNGYRELYTSAYWERQNLKLSDMEANANRNNALKKGLNWIGNGIQRFDLATTDVLWQAAKIYVDQNTGLQPGTEEEIRSGQDAYYQKVAEIYNEILEKSQPEYNVWQRPGILRSKSQLMKAMTMFKTQSLQNLGMTVEAFSQLKDARETLKENDTAENREAVSQAKRQLANTISSQVVSAIVLAVFSMLGKALFHRMRDYKDDKGDITAASAGRQLAKDSVSSMAGMVVGGSELFDLVMGWIEGKAPYDIEAAGVSTINDLYQNTFALGAGVSGLFDSDLTPEEKMTKFAPKAKKFASSLVQLFGIPMDNAIKLVDGIATNAKEFALGKPLSFEEGGFLGAAQGRETSNADVAGYIAQAMMDGNTAEAERLYNGQLAQGKTPEAINTAIATWQKANIPEIREAAEAIENGDVNLYNALIKEITQKGISTANAVKYVESERKKMQKAEEAAKAPETKPAAGPQRMTYEQITAGMTKEASEQLYTNGMMNSLLEDGNVEQAVAVKNAMMEAGKKQSSISSSLSNYWKPILLEAYEAGDMMEVKRITDMLVSMGMKRSTIQGWTGTKSSSSKKSAFGKSSFGSGFGKSAFGSGTFGSGSFGKTAGKKSSKKKFSGKSF